MTKSSPPHTIPADASIEASIDAVYAAVRSTGGPELPSATVGLTQVAHGVRVLALRTPTLPPAAHTSCYLLGPTDGAGGLVVVDPGSPYDNEGARLAAILVDEAAAGRPVQRVLLTHHHGDHVGGAPALRARFGIPIAAHAATAARLADWLLVDELLDDDVEITTGARTWRTVFTPGHAPGHLCLHDAIDGVVVAGDMVAGVGTILIDPTDGDMTLYLASLERLAALQPTRLLPAHGPVIDDAVPRLHGYRAHRLAREAKVNAAVRALGPATVSALVAHAYADTPTPLWPLAERSLRAHLARLIWLGVVTSSVDADAAQSTFRLL